VLPDIVVSREDVMGGALVTGLMFAVGRYGIAAYRAATATASTYGAAAAIAIVLSWVDYSALILLLGAALTRAHVEGKGQERGAEGLGGQGGPGNRIAVGT
jgi:membrane protein